MVSVTVETWHICFFIAVYCFFILSTLSIILLVLSNFYLSDMAGLLPGDTEPPESVVPADGVPADNLGDRRGDGLSLHVHGLGGRGQAVRRAPPPLHRRETSGDPGK